MKQGTPPTLPGLSNKSDVGSMKKRRKMTTEEMENTMKQLYEMFLCITGEVTTEASKGKKI